MAGCLISFEGGEGSGKSTQIATLAERLREAGHRVLTTREPGGTEIGESIRHLLQHDAAGAGMCAATELLLFAASRAQHVHERIAPALDRGEIVLCDRFLDSTAVYQGVARAIDPADVAAINAFAVGSVMPRLTLVLDLPPEVGLQRALNNTPDGPDRLEREAIQFHENVRRGYLELARSNPRRVEILDAAQDREALHDEIWELVSPVVDSR
jgi:dTMP kinase